MIYTESIPDSFHSVLFVPLVRTYFSTLINTAFSGTVTPTTSISSFVPIVLSVSGGGIGTKDTLGDFWEISNESELYNSTDFSVWSKKGSPFFVFCFQSFFAKRPEGSPRSRRQGLSIRSLRNRR